MFEKIKKIVLALLVVASSATGGAAMAGEAWGSSTSTSISPQLLSPLSSPTSSMHCKETDLVSICEEIQRTQQLLKSMRGVAESVALNNYLNTLEEALKEWRDVDSWEDALRETTIADLSVLACVLGEARATLLEEAETWKLWRLVKKIEAPAWTGPVPKRFIRRGPAALEPPVDWDAVQAQIWVDDLHASV